MTHPLAWKIYIWVFIVVLAISFAGRLVLRRKMPEIVKPLDIFEGAVGLCAIPALLGFLHQQAVPPRALWMLVSVAAVVLAVIQCFAPKTRMLFEKGKARAIATKALEAVVGLPGLYAVIRYSFFEPSLWR